VKKKRITPKKYKEDLQSVKDILKGISFEAEGFFKIERRNQEEGVVLVKSMVSERLEIVFNKTLPEKDYYEITVLVLPEISEDYERPPVDWIHYLYWIKGNRIKRVLKLSRYSAALTINFGSGPLEELIYFLIEARYDEFY